MTIWQNVIMSLKVHTTRGLCFLEWRLLILPINSWFFLLADDNESVEHMSLAAFSLEAKTSISSSEKDVDRVTGSWAGLQLLISLKGTHTSPEAAMVAPAI